MFLVHLDSTWEEKSRDFTKICLERIWDETSRMSFSEMSQDDSRLSYLDSISILEVSSWNIPNSHEILKGHSRYFSRFILECMQWNIGINFLQILLFKSIRGQLKTSEVRLRWNLGKDSRDFISACLNSICIQFDSRMNIWFKYNNLQSSRPR